MRKILFLFVSLLFCIDAFGRDGDATTVTAVLPWGENTGFSTPGSPYHMFPSVYVNIHVGGSATWNVSVQGTFIGTATAPFDIIKRNIWGNYNGDFGTSRDGVVTLSSGADPTGYSGHVFTEIGDRVNQTATTPDDVVVDLYFTGASPAQTFHFPWRVKTNISQWHTLQLVCNGVKVFEQQFHKGTNGGDALENEGTVNYTMHVASGTYQWYVDGSADQGGLLTPPTDRSDVTFALFDKAFITDAPAAPAPSGTNPATLPTPTPSPTPAPNPTPAPVPANAGNVDNSSGGNSSHTVNNASTTLTGSSAGMTNQDMYNDVRQGVMDAGKSSSASAAASATPSTDISGSMAERGHIDDLQGIVDTGTADIGHMVSSGSNIQSLFTGHTLPSVGSSSSFSLGTVHIMGTAIPMALDLTPYSALCALVRSVMLALSGWLFLMASIKAVREYL